MQTHTYERQICGHLYWHLIEILGTIVGTILCACLQRKKLRKNLLLPTRLYRFLNYEMAISDNLDRTYVLDKGLRRLR